MRKSGEKVLMFPTSHSSAGGHCWLLLRDLRNDALNNSKSQKYKKDKKSYFDYLSSAKERGDAGSVSQGSSHHLGGIDDAGTDHVDHLLIGSVEAFIDVPAVGDLVHNDGGVQPGVVRDGVERSGESILDDGDTFLLIFILRGQTFHSGEAPGKY